MSVYISYIFWWKASLCRSWYWKNNTCFNNCITGNIVEILVVICNLPATSRWWFQIFFEFSPRKLGKISTQFDLHIFFPVGWFNHQLETVIVHPSTPYFALVNLLVTRDKQTSPCPTEKPGALYHSTREWQPLSFRQLWESAFLGPSAEETHSLWCPSTSASTISWGLGCLSFWVRGLIRM